MLQEIQGAITPKKDQSLARAFYRLGWAGFWIQLVFGSLPVLVMAYYFAFAGSGEMNRSGVPYVEYLAVVNLLILGFTLYWSYRYTRLARRITDPEKRPSESSVVGSVWTGVVASSVGLLFSMVVLLLETAKLLFSFLKTPQGGIPVIQTAGTASMHFVSSVDMVSLMALVLTLFAEQVVLIFSLWLLFRTTLGSPEFPRPADTPAAPGGNDLVGSAVAESALPVQGHVGPTS